MKKNFLLLLIVVLVACSTKSFALPITPEVKKVVAFIFVSDKDGRPVPQGTGFFVGIKHSQKPDAYFVYLVTAKHVLQTKNKKSWLSTVFVRLNKKEAGSELLRLDMFPEGEKKNVFIHEDPTVDMAVVPVRLDDNKHDFKFIPEDFLTSKDDYQKLNINEGLGSLLYRIVHSTHWRAAKLSNCEVWQSRIGYG